VPGFDAVAWLMLVAPAGMPAAIVGKLHTEAKAIVAAGDVQQQLIALGVIPISSPPPAELSGFVKSEVARWGKVVQQAGLAGSE
jgi:tripartite-type tricarboxylate transporter receptor subunit TctC